MSAVPPAPDTEPIRAAGVVCLRAGDDGTPELLIVHRRRRDDWSLPKGKLEVGEHVVAAAVREAAEETGYRVVLGPPAGIQRYLVEGRPKIVDYWTARSVGRGAWSPDDEVDEVRWIPVALAREQLTFAHDVTLVEKAARLPTDTVPFVLLRHAQAEKRADFADRYDGKPPHDSIRPLTRIGQTQAQDLVLVLAAFGVVTVHTSDSVRCVDTIAPYTDAAALPITMEPDLSEAGFEHHHSRALRRVTEMLHVPTALVLCTHRPVLPDVTRRIHRVVRGHRPEHALPPGGFVVLHRRIAESRVRAPAIETHDP